MNGETSLSRYRDNSFPGELTYLNIVIMDFLNMTYTNQSTGQVPGFVYNLNFNTRFKFALPGYKGGYFLDSIPVNLPYVPIKMETPVLYFLFRKKK